MWSFRVRCKASSHLTIHFTPRTPHTTVFSCATPQILIHLNPADEHTIRTIYVCKLGFEEHPDYKSMRKLFGKVLKTSGDVDDGMLDWMTSNEARVSKAGSVSRLVLCTSDGGVLSFRGVPWRTAVSFPSTMSLHPRTLTSPTLIHDSFASRT